MKSLVALAAFTLASGLVFAQGPARRPMGPPMMGGLDGGLLGGPNVERRLTKALNLNATQQNDLHTALAERDLTLKGTTEKSQDLRQQLGAAIRAGDEGKIDQITRDMAALSQQQQSITAKTLAKVYKSLDTTQKATIERVIGPQLGVRPQQRLQRQAVPKAQ